MGTGVQRKEIYQSNIVLTTLVKDYIKDIDNNDTDDREAKIGSFYVITKIINKIHPIKIPGELGLLINTINISFIDHLYTNHLINHKSFTIKYNHAAFGGMITFGKDFNDSIIRTIPIKYSNWNWRFSKYTLGYRSITIKTIIYFNPSFSFITGPNEEILTLLNIIITKGKCSLKSFIVNKELANTLQCQSNLLMEQLPELIFYKNNKEDLLRIKMSNLFISKHNEDNNDIVMICLIISDKNRKHWILGLPAFDGNSLVFDQIERIIGFYYNNITYNNISRIIIVMIKIIIFCMIIGICLCFYTKKYFYNKVHCIVYFK